MKKLTLHANHDLSYITVPTDFIDLFMPEASAVELKVYLYLLRASADPSILLSVQDMTDLFDVTQNRVIQALRRWESAGLLSLSEKDGEITDITLLPVPKGEVPAADSAPLSAAAVKRTEEAPEAQAASPVITGIPERAKTERTDEDAPALDIASLYADDGFTEILALAEFYTKKSLSPSQQNALASCYLLMDRQADIVEYLIESCIDNGHTSFRYMEAVAKRWRNEGLMTLDAIRASASFRNETVYKTLKALGIRRDPVASEESMILKWAGDFDLPLILEACDRTMRSLHMPDFKYTDGILNRWKEAGVRTLADVAELDVQHEDRKKAGKKRASQANRTESRGTDYDQLFSGYYSA